MVFFFTHVFIALCCEFLCWVSLLHQGHLEHLAPVAVLWAEKSVKLNLAHQIIVQKSGKFYSRNL